MIRSYDSCQGGTNHSRARTYTRAALLALPVGGKLGCGRVHPHHHRRPLGERQAGGDIYGPAERSAHVAAAVHCRLGEEIRTATLNPEP